MSTVSHVPIMLLLGFSLGMSCHAVPVPFRVSDPSLLKTRNMKRLAGALFAFRGRAFGVREHGQGVTFVLMPRGNTQLPTAYPSRSLRVRFAVSATSVRTGLEVIVLGTFKEASPEADGRTFMEAVAVWSPSTSELEWLAGSEETARRWREGSLSLGG